MKLPILGKLKDGEKFDFVTLADNIDETDEFWNWWWAEKADLTAISRPEIIQDDDPILVQTCTRPVVNLGCYPHFFDRTLANLIQQGRLPSRDGYPREHFRDLLSQTVAASSVKLPSRPKLVFGGGGYGSGKTTTLNHLANAGALPLPLPCLIGVDVFKPLIPEFNLIKAVADGRASFTVQKECSGLASDLFEDLTEAGRSFMWDSSMGNRDESFARIRSARERGYELTLIAVLTHIDVAVRQAMHRAKLSRRFPHPEALPSSHKGFKANFHDYVVLFDEVKVFANLAKADQPCYLVAEKECGSKELVILDEDLFNRALI